jgi:hypothetical protein
VLHGSPCVISRKFKSVVFAAGGEGSNEGSS